MAPPDPRCTIGTKIDTKAVFVTSLDECSRHYRVNKKNIILVGIVLEVEIGLKATKLDWRRNFFIAKFDLGGGNMKVYTINIRSVKLHTLEPIFTATEGDGGERADSATKTTTGYKNITDSVSIRVFEAPALDPLN